MTNIQILRNQIDSLYLELEKKEQYLCGLFDVLDYTKESGVDLAENVFYKIQTVEFEIDEIKETIISYEREIKKLQGGL